MTQAQIRLIETIRACDGCAEYWPVVNDWVKDAGPAKLLALRNINRTVEALIKAGLITVDEDGMFQLTERAR